MTTENKERCVEVKTPSQLRHEQKVKAVEEEMKKGVNGPKLLRTESGATPNGNDILD